MNSHVCVDMWACSHELYLSFVFLSDLLPYVCLCACFMDLFICVFVCGCMPRAFCINVCFRPPILLGHEPGAGGCDPDLPLAVYGV